MNSNNTDNFHWRRRRAIAAYLLLKLKKSKRNRSVGTCKIFKLRGMHGVYHSLVQEMRLTDEKKFYNYHRMSIEDFDKLEEKLSPILAKTYHSTEPITPGEMLSATLRYLASGTSMKSISYIYRLGVSTVSYTIKNTCSAIWTVLQKECLQAPTEEVWKQIAEGFNLKWNFPNCIGAIDGKHIRIKAPPNTGSDFYNYKEYSSMILLAICDAEYRFTVVDIGAKGRQSDGGVFRASNFGKRFFSNGINLPSPSKLTENGEPLPYFLVADAAFPFSINMMRPYPGQYLPQNERVFNYRLSRARRVIENAFGILVSKWRIVERPIIAKLETIEVIICAVVCLHNYLRSSDVNKPDNSRYCSPNYVDRETGNGEIIPGEWRSSVNRLESAGRMGGNAYTQTASDIRNKLTEYFMNIDPIMPQWSK